MIYAAIAKNNDSVFSSYLVPFLDRYNIKACIASDEEGKRDSIFVKYNQCITALINEGLKNDDIVLFVHEDVKLLDPNFVSKLELMFSEKKDVGLVGVVGVTELSENCRWWDNKPDKLKGHIIQENGQQAYHMVKGMVGYSDDLVAVDGLCFAVRADLLLGGLRFDDTFKGFHFYDLDICCQILSMGHKIAIADILVLHKSIGDISKSEGWMENKDKFFKKWSVGYKFPLTSRGFINNNIKEIEV
jgi:hypothetical protein